MTGLSLVYASGSQSTWNVYVEQRDEQYNLEEKEKNPRRKKRTQEENTEETKRRDKHEDEEEDATALASFFRQTERPIERH